MRQREESIKSMVFEEKKLIPTSSQNLTSGEKRIGAIHLTLSLFNLAIFFKR
jgi:hypothetical protein